MSIDGTHAPGLQSWVPGADDLAGDFPIQNLPLCVFRRPGISEAFRPGVGIGGFVLDLRAAAEGGLLPQELTTACSASRLNLLFSMGRDSMRRLRQSLFDQLVTGAARRDTVQALLLPLEQAEFAVPCDIGDYTDFFTSLDHAMNTFRMARSGQPFLPNFKHLPIAYHGRSSSVVVSGHRVARPSGQYRPNPEADPVLAPSVRMDFECEIGAYVGCGNALGSSISLDAAEQCLAGVSLFNDWSARDIQRWESLPLGPFLGKNFLTSVSPWVVTLDALEPFRVPPPERPAGDPAPLGYLDSTVHRQRGAIDIHVETLLATQGMREASQAPVRISEARFSRDVYWSLFQMVAQHTVNGCNLRTGDLIGSGTVSGPAQGNQGSLLELAHGGTRPLTLPNGEKRSFLEDGDELILRAFCLREGYRRIGFGECRGILESG